MFDFENLKVYQKARKFNKHLWAKIEIDAIGRSSSYQLQRAALSIMLNIAEGSGRFTKPDKRRFYIMARGSLFETVAILQLILDEKLISQQCFDRFYGQADEISKMLYAMISNLE